MYKKFITLVWQVDTVLIEADLAQFLVIVMVKVTLFFYIL